MDVEATGLHSTLDNRGQVHSRSDAAKEAICLHRLSADFLANNLIDYPAPTLYCDSQSAIYLSWNLIYHAKMKRIVVRYHHILELVIDKKVDIRKVDIEVNIVDSLTKPLSDQRFKALRGHTGLQQASKQRGAERGAEGKLKNNINRQVETAKSKEVNSQKHENAPECEKNEREGDD